MADEEKKGSLVHIDMGNLGDAAKALIERVANGCGVYYEPRRIVKKAAAEAEAEKIKALAKIELQDIERRALQRLVHEEAKKQENIEAITEQALKYLPEDAHPEKIQEDWMMRFLEKSKTISDKEIQDLWARILAGEAKQSGRFSVRTMDILHNMSKNDAEWFTRVCSFCWQNGPALTPMIFNTTDEIFLKGGHSFVTLQHLDTIGLINFNHLAGFTIQAMGILCAFYYGRPLFINATFGKPIPTGQVMLTEAGNQLASLTKAKPIEGLWEDVKLRMEKSGIEIVSFDAYKNAR